MPNLANAKKTLRQSEKRANKNRVILDEIHSLRRRFRKLVEAGSLEDAKKLTQTINKKADKAAGKGIIKKNRAGRIKSRMMSSLKPKK